MTAAFALNSVGFGSSSDFSRAIAAGWVWLWLVLNVAGFLVHLQSDRGEDTPADTGGRAGTWGTVLLPRTESLNFYLKGRVYRTKIRQKLSGSLRNTRSFCFILRANPECFWFYQPRLFYMSSILFSNPQGSSGLIEVPSLSHWSYYTVHKTLTFLCKSGWN